MMRKNGLTEIESDMIASARSIGTSCSIKAAQVNFRNTCAAFMLHNYSETAVINVYREFIIQQKALSQPQTCGCHRLQNIPPESRIAKVVQSNRTTLCPVAMNICQEAIANVSERTEHKSDRLLH